MKLCILTPRLFIAACERETVPRLDRISEREQVAEASARTPSNARRVDVDYKYLFTDHSSFRVRLCHRTLRTLSTFGWLPSWPAALALRLCKEEVVETLRAYDPDVVSGLNLPWADQLETFLKGHCPEWFVASAQNQEPCPPPRPSMNPAWKVSIVLPTYNGVRYLRESVESCLRQTLENIELIVVDDGSGPEVGAILESYRADGRLKYVRHERNRGVAAALNTGFRLSTGSHLTWTSDDNYYERNAVAEMLGFLARYPDVDFVYAGSYEVNDEGTITRLLRPLPPAALKVNNFVGACFLYKRHVYERVGDYREVFLAEDYDYWIRVARTCRMQRLLKPLYYYRTHPDSLTGRYSPSEVDDRVSDVKRLNRFGSRENRLKQRG
jgi:hypothetical protein